MCLQTLKPRRRRPRTPLVGRWERVRCSRKVQPVKNQRRSCLYYRIYLGFGQWKRGCCFQETPGKDGKRRCIRCGYCRPKRRHVCSEKS